MNNFDVLLGKLEGFVRKFYMNELLKGGLLFLIVGLLYFLIILSIEYFLWLSPTGRTVLFVCFIGVEVYLVYRFLAVPMFFLLKIKKGLDYKLAAGIIGKHFPDVSDKLLNVLQLAEDTQQSELLLAGIDQKAKDLKPVPFQLAINFKDNLKYVKYLAIPVIILCAFWLSGNLTYLKDSYARMVHFKTAYEAPAPFRFDILGDSLTAFEGEAFTIQVRTEGVIAPEQAQINFNGASYYLKSSAPGSFEYTFQKPDMDLRFTLSANDVVSREFNLKVTKVPVLSDFTMKLMYPKYTGKQDAIVRSTGNAIVPEGTTVVWELLANNTTAIDWIDQDSVFPFEERDSKFVYTRKALRSMDYAVETSNQQVKAYERIGYSLDVIKDEYPEIMVDMRRDSLNFNKALFLGQVSDDYGVSDLKVVCYPVDKENQVQQLILPIRSSVLEQFAYDFPQGFKLEDGITYQVYFEVRDSDGVNGKKLKRSQVFSFHNLSSGEVNEEQLKQQEQTIKDMERSLEQLDKDKKALEDFNQLNKEKNNLSFNERRKLESFVDRQQKQYEMMKEYTKDLQENFNRFESDPSSEEERMLLEERLKRQEEELKRNQDLLDQLKKLGEKINQEDLSKRLEELANQQQNDKRNLRQILELTKRYYVSEKAGQIQRELEELSRKQDALSERKSSAEEQKKAGEEFKEIKKSLDDLEKENEGLKKPMDLGRDKGSEETVDDLQKDAEEKLGEEEQKKDQDQQKDQLRESAKSSQKKAAQKMKEMSESMNNQMSMSGAQTLQEDVATLRQILDNLVEFSFDQEDLMDRFQRTDESSPNYSKYLNEQNNLKELFSHVDDSLFALSLRKPELTEVINKNITDVFYNMDKAMERFAESQFYQGISNQQYALTASNELSDFLSNVLDNMQESLSGSSSGSGKGMQLPDIIKSQEELNKQMQDGMQKGQEKGPGKEGEGSVPEPGEGQQGKQQGMSERESQMLFEIYQEQQRLREALERQINDQMGGAGNQELKDAKKLAEEMEQVEKELLQGGYNQNTLNKMMNLQHQLLKLDEAALKQGKKSERESRSNSARFVNPVNDLDPSVKQYFNETEILNRQVLPLRQNYKKKVREYFKKDD